MTPIESFEENYNAIQDFLMQQQQISYSIDVGNNYRKILLLSCASLYESQITAILKNFVQKSTQDVRIHSFVDTKAIARQYHTYFDWNDSNNINRFLGLFGNDFKKNISEKIKKDDDLRSGMKAFLSLGGERNKMVHGNFMSYQLEKTWEEIMSEHKKAEVFVCYLQSIFEIL